MNYSWNVNVYVLIYEVVSLMMINSVYLCYLTEIVVFFCHSWYFPL